MYLATIDKNGNKWTHKLTDGDEASKRSEMLPIPGITGGQYQPIQGRRCSRMQWNGENINPHNIKNSIRTEMEEGG